MRTLLSLLLFVSLPALAADELHLYNWNDYIAPEAVKNVITKSSIDSVNAISAPAMTPGMMSGSVT